MTDETQPKTARSGDSFATHFPDMERARFSGDGKALLKSWLQVGLERFFLEKAGRWAFEPFELEIQQEPELSLDLYNIYLQSDAISRSHFRLAVAELIAEVPSTPAFSNMFECLLELARLMPAYEVLRVLPARIGSDQFGTMRDSHGDTYFDRVMAAVVQLATATDDARKCLEALITSPHFESSYALQAFVALCRIDPDHWSDHLAFLRTQIHRLFTAHKIDAASSRRHAGHFLDAVGLIRVRDHLSDLRPNYTDAEGIPSDNWLFGALFQGPQSLLLWRQPNDGFKAELQYRSNPAITTEVSPEIQDAVLMRVRRGRVTPAVRKPVRMTPSRSPTHSTTEQLRSRFGLQVPGEVHAP